MRGDILILILQTKKGTRVLASRVPIKREY